MARLKLLKSLHGPGQGTPVRSPHESARTGAGLVRCLGALCQGPVAAGTPRFDRKRGAGLRQLSMALRDRKFIPEPASLIFIAKLNHPEERRPITLIRPEDRIVLTCLNRLLTPLFERQFLLHPYSYRPGRGAWTAIERVTKCLRQRLARTAERIPPQAAEGQSWLALRLHRRVPGRRRGPLRFQLAEFGRGTQDDR